MVRERKLGNMRVPLMFLCKYIFPLVPTAFMNTWAPLMFLGKCIFRVLQTVSRKHQGLPFRLRSGDSLSLQTCALSAAESTIRILKLGLHRDGFSLPIMADGR